MKKNSHFSMLVQMAIIHSLNKENCCQDGRRSSSSDEVVVIKLLSPMGMIFFAICWTKEVTLGKTHTHSQRSSSPINFDFND
jgi:hypothetical protein